MTGFGQASVERSGLRVNVEVRSLNNRFADVRMRLPAELFALEREWRARLLASSRRGRVELTLTAERTQPGAVEALNEPLLSAVLAAADRLREVYGLPGGLDVATVMALPGMVRADAEAPGWGPIEQELAHEAVEAAIAALDADRLREGRALAAELLERTGAMERLAGRIAERAAEVPRLQRERLAERLRSLAAELALDPARLAQEAAVLAERADVTEELVRLRGHLRQLRELLERPDAEPLGKRLEFLLQELQREANTLSSKAADLELTRAALAVKSELEKVREQVQNLE